jgi:hypothetical protein
MTFKMKISLSKKPDNDCFRFTRNEISTAKNNTNSQEQNKVTFIMELFPDEEAKFALEQKRDPTVGLHLKLEVRPNIVEDHTNCTITEGNYNRSFGALPENSNVKMQLNTQFYESLVAATRNLLSSLSGNKGNMEMKVQKYDHVEENSMDVLVTGLEPQMNAELPDVTKSFTSMDIEVTGIKPQRASSLIDDYINLFNPHLCNEGQAKLQQMQRKMMKMLGVGASPLQNCSMFTHKEAEAKTSNAKEGEQCLIL